MTALAFVLGGSVGLVLGMVFSASLSGEKLATAAQHVRHLAEMLADADPYESGMTREQRVEFLVTYGTWPRP